MAGIIEIYRVKKKETLVATNSNEVHEALFVVAQSSFVVQLTLVHIAVISRSE